MEREGIDINGRLEVGAYFGPAEIETLAEACSLRTSALRRLNSKTASEIREGETRRIVGRRAIRIDDGGKALTIVEDETFAAAKYR